MPRFIDADKCKDYFYEHLDDKNMEIAMNAINEMPEEDIITMVRDQYKRRRYNVKVFTYLFDNKPTFEMDDVDTVAFMENANKWRIVKGDGEYYIENSQVVCISMEVENGIYGL